MNLKQLRNHIRFSPIAHSVVLAANHGVGKSQVTFSLRLDIAQVVGTLIDNVGFVDIRLSQNDVGDLKGLPKSAGGRTFFAPPFWFPMGATESEKIKALIEHIGEVFSDPKTPEYGILFLDELNRASKEVLQCAMELVLDRRLNGISIPKGWKVMAAINHNADIYQVFELDPALLDRFSFIEFKPTVEEWLDWAGDKNPETGKDNVHSAVKRYIESFPDYLDPKDEEIDAATKSTSKIHSRRSWDKLSECLYSYENNLPHGAPDLTDPSNEDDLVIIAKSYVGSAQAISFSAFVRDKYDVITPDKVIHSWSEELGSRIHNLCTASPLEIAALTNSLIKRMEESLGESSEIFSDEIELALSNYILSLTRENVSGLFTSMSKHTNPRVNNAMREFFSTRAAMTEHGKKAKAAITASMRRAKS